MAEYITKETAIQAFEWGDADVFEEYGDDCNSGFSRESIKSAINTIPAADVAPVVYGQWVHLGGDEWCCSACGFVISTEGSWEKPTKKYCEDCGAKMEQEVR